MSLNIHQHVIIQVSFVKFHADNLNHVINKAVLIDTIDHTGFSLAILKVLALDASTPHLFYVPCPTRSRYRDVGPKSHNVSLLPLYTGCAPRHFRFALSFLISPGVALTVALTTWEAGSPIWRCALGPWLGWRGTWRQSIKGPQRNYSWEISLGKAWAAELGNQAWRSCHAGITDPHGDLSKHEALGQWLSNVGAPSETVAQHYSNMESVLVDRLTDFQHVKVCKSPGRQSFRPCGQLTWLNSQACST